MRNASSPSVRPNARQATNSTTWRLNGIWLVAIGAALWGTDSVLRMPLLQTFSAVEIVLLEHLLLAIYAIPVLWLNRHQLRGLTYKQWGAILFISWGGSGIATSLFTEAFAYGNPNVVLLLQKLQPLIVFLMARTMLKEKLPRHFGWYLLIALLGTYLLTFGFSTPFSGGGRSESTAALLAIGAAALWGGSTVMGRILLDKMTFETVTGARFLFALPFMAVVVLNSGSNFGHLFSEFAAWKPFGLVFLQALLPGLISLLLYYRGLSTTKASYATLAELAFPAAGVLLNWAFFQQTLTAGQFTGFVIIWLIVFRLATDKQRHA
ncbi:MAG: DMT family transporter [Tumebacillaceae bacterium]